MMNGMNPFGGMVMMVVGPVIVILIIIALAVWISRLTRRNNDHDSALAILRDRYARGEINRKEFEERKQNLNQ